MSGVGKWKRKGESWSWWAMSDRTSACDIDKDTHRSVC